MTVRPKDYLHAVAHGRKSGNATEHTHRPALKALLDSKRYQFFGTSTMLWSALLEMKKIFVTAMIIGCLSIPLIAPAQPAGGGDLIFAPQNAPPVVFSHNKHLKEREGLKCSGCHYQLFQMAQGSYKMDMGKITKGEFCGRCHNGRVSFDVQDPKNCSFCHR